MIFEAGNLYHIYNQGNNRQKIFFSNENYLYFLTKLKGHFLPHADILAWCLMPNHFHLMVYVHSADVVCSGDVCSGGATQSRTPTTNKVAPTTNTTNKTNLNKSIGILLASYTRAINKQENRTGSLFRDKTKAECITKMDGITPSFYNTSHGAVIYPQMIEREYPQVCFDYIHNNPVKAGLVEQPEEWMYSSCCDFKGLRNGKLINKQRVEEFGIVF